ncbi:LEA type 2 family protein [Pseudomonas sp. UBA6310]|uniref:LEA type 2 family protein n=1 Tax=Pseudomonas sp. UBA6310 TaxID=1947327 RepID=UPI00257AA5A6|nr:LEA type 2 family protein [Pseudomonas sp. UBA6310]
MRHRHASLAPVRLPLLLLLLASLAACSSLAPRDPLRIDLAGIEPLPGQGLEMRFAVQLRVQNPNDDALDYDGVALDLEVNGQPLASGVSDRRGEIPRFGEALVSVPVTISAFSVMRQTWGLGLYQPGQGLPYRLKGKFASGLFGTQRFSDSGTLTWPEPPTSP